MGAIASLVVVDLECADPAVLAEFYRQVLGWDVTLHGPEFAEISGGGNRILFSRVEGYEGPGWPDSLAPKRYHLCLQADHVAEAVEHCLELGAEKPVFQPGGDRWTVLIDPSGHPFCLAQAG